MRLETTILISSLYLLIDECSKKNQSRPGTCSLWRILTSNLSTIFEKGSVRTTSCSSMFCTAAVSGQREWGWVGDCLSSHLLWRTGCFALLSKRMQEWQCIAGDVSQALLGWLSWWQAAQYVQKFSCHIMWGTTKMRCHVIEARTQITITRKYSNADDGLIPLGRLIQTSVSFSETRKICELKGRLLAG